MSLRYLISYDIYFIAFCFPVGLLKFRSSLLHAKAPIQSERVERALRRQLPAVELLHLETVELFLLDNQYHKGRGGYPAT